MGKLVPVFINTLASWIRKSAERSTTFAPWANKSGYHFHESASRERQRKTTSQAFAQVSASKTLISTSLPGTLRKRIKSRVFPLPLWSEAQTRRMAGWRAPEPGQFHARIAAYADTRPTLISFIVIPLFYMLARTILGPLLPTLAITLDDVFEPELAKQAFRSEDYTVAPRRPQCLCRSISRTSILCLAKSISFSQFPEAGSGTSPRPTSTEDAREIIKSGKVTSGRGTESQTSSLTHKPPVISV